MLLTAHVTCTPHGVHPPAQALLHPAPPLTHIGTTKTQQPQPTSEVAHLVSAPHAACMGCDLHTARQPCSSSRASLGTARAVSKKRSVRRARCLGSADSSRGDTHSRASRVRELPHTSSAKAESGPVGGVGDGVEEGGVETEG